MQKKNYLGYKKSTINESHKNYLGYIYICVCMSYNHIGWCDVSHLYNQGILAQIVRQKSQIHYQFCKLFKFSFNPTI
jgi:hypothetical protein